MMKALPILSLMAGLLFIGCKKEEASAPKSSTSGGNPVTAPVDYLAAAAKAKQNAAKVVSGVGLDKAIQLFYANEGRYPKELNELVRPDYLGAIPPPPVGMRYDYNPTNGVVKVVPK
jgi:hypothetical protein